MRRARQRRQGSMAGEVANEIELPAKAGGEVIAADDGLAGAAAQLREIAALADRLDDGVSDLRGGEEIDKKAVLAMAHDFLDRRGGRSHGPAGRRQRFPRRPR